MATREHVFELLFATSGKRNVRIQHVINAICKTNEDSTKSEDCIKREKQMVYNCCNAIYERWNKCNRRRAIFARDNSNWLKQKVLLPLQESQKPGRPTTSFQSSSERSKRRKTGPIREVYTASELSYATQMTLRSQGETDASCLLKEAMATPTRASKIRRAWQAEKTPLGSPSPDEALALMVNAQLSKHQYQLVRDWVKGNNADVCPTYNAVRAAKKRCYPENESLTVSERVAEVRLQAVLDHTVLRIFSAHEIPSRVTDAENVTFTLTCKWGFDGSTGHSEYKQRFLEEGDISDADMFVTSFVPVQLVASYKKEDKEEMLWKNPHPSSTRYCRPIRFQFKKESSVLILQEKLYIEKQISELNPTCVYVDGLECKVFHNMLLTMVDGKVCSTVTSTSSQTCYICKCTPREMNNIDRSVERSRTTTNVNFGLSILHAWIKFFEYFLHVSYRLHVKKWQVRSDSDKRDVEQRKKCIQGKFRSELGLLVDRVKCGGSGTTNDGNTARRFFRNFNISADITGIDKEVIQRCAIILQVLSSGQEISVTDFERYALKAGRLLITKYPWYYLPVTVHKILIHGAQIIKHALVPIGQLSEEAQEALHKQIKLNRLRFTRKFSRLATNEDLLHSLLVSSDPVISQLRFMHRSHSKPVSRDAHVLLASRSSEERAILEEDVESSCSDGSE